ncbi:MAG: hypothetical protein EHM79_10980 [Geobacter sp.]|nr:MAG: hypothetical protein EHM79_10980 [Geobacter sp.]
MSLRVMKTINPSPVNAIKPRLHAPDEWTRPSASSSLSKPRQSVDGATAGAAVFQHVQVEVAHF